MTTALYSMHSKSPNHVDKVREKNELEFPLLKL